MSSATPPPLFTPTPPATTTSSRQQNKENNNTNSPPPSRSKKQQQHQQEEEDMFNDNNKNINDENLIDDNTRRIHCNHSRGGMRVVRKLQQNKDDPFGFDAFKFQGLSREEIAELRSEVHSRCKISNSTSWRRDVNHARGVSSAHGAKRMHTEGSEIVLYSKPVTKHVSTPKIEPDASIQRRMGDFQRTPGALDYYPRLPETRLNNRWIGFLPSSPPKRLQGELDTYGPTCQSYFPHRALGEDQPKWTCGKRPQWSTGGTVEDDPNRFCTAATYIPPISDFDVDRKMPNGATSSKFFLTRSNQYHIPGPFDTAATSTSKWVWRDKKDKRWKIVGRSNVMEEFDPPESVVKVLKEKREKMERQEEEEQQERRKQRRQQQQEENAASQKEEQENEKSNNKKTSTTSSSNKKAAISHRHHPSLLMLHELHKRGYQLIRFASNIASSEKQFSSNNSSARRSSSSSSARRKTTSSSASASASQTKQEEEKSTTQPKSNEQEKEKEKEKEQQEEDNAAPSLTTIHFATKFNVCNGFSLKPGSSVKELGAVTDPIKYFNAVGGYRPTVSSTQKNESQEQKQKREQERKDIKEAIEKACDQFIASNSDFCHRTKGRDFTYCSWLEKVLRTQLESEDCPVGLEEADRSNFVFGVTVRGYHITAPPVK